MAAGSWYIVVPRAGTNLCINPSVEENATVGFGTIGVGTAIAQSGTHARWGAYSVGCTPAGAVVDAGMLTTITGATIGLTYCGSVWVRGSVGIPYRLYFGTAAGVVKAGCTPTTFTGDGAWHRYEVTFVADAANLYLCVSKNHSVSAVVFYCDGWQCEVAAEATTYIDGDQPGCEWLGRPGLSTSARAAHAGGGGVIVDLEDYDINITTTVGLGMPPLKSRATATPSMPGARRQDAHVEPRVVTISCWSQGLTATGLDRAREQLLHALRDDRVATPQPVTLRFETAARTFELHAYYDAGLERNPSEYRFERWPLRLICYDPFLYEIGAVAAVLDVGDSATWSYIAGRLRDTGRWDDFGPPAAGDVVRAICIAQDGTIFVGGLFTGWDGVVGNDYLVMWDGTAWQNVGGAAAFNARVDALMMSANPRILVVGGSFTNAGGIGAADYVCLYNLDTGVLAALAAGGTGPVYALALATNGDIYIGGDFADWNAIGAADNIVAWDVSAGAYAAVGAGLDSIVYALVVSRRGDHLYAGGAFDNDGTPVAMRGVARFDGVSWAEVGGGLDNAGATGVVRALALDAAGDLYAGGTFDRTADGLLTGLNYVARFDGQAWQPLGYGCDNTVYALACGPDGMIHAGGFFTSVDDPPITSNYYARWNGTAWLAVDMVLPAGIVYAVALGRPDPAIAANYDVLLGFSVSGTAAYAGAATATNTGSRRAYPYMRLRRTGGTGAYLRALRNESNGLEIGFNDLELLDGETIIVDCRPGQRRVYSDRRDNLLGYVIVPTALAEFYLEPETEQRTGANTITALVVQVGAPTIRAEIMWTRTDWSVDAS